MNAAKVFMKDNGMDNSMEKVKSLMFKCELYEINFRHVPMQTEPNIN